MKNSLIEFDDLMILDGVNTHPGSGNINQHIEEINTFKLILSDIDNKENPLMIEIGCFWAIWSLLFKKRYRNGKNILIELGKRQLAVGKFNFEINNFDCSSYHGGFFINESLTFKNRAHDIEYDALENIDLQKFIQETAETDNLVGPELDFDEIYQKEKIDVIDIIHADIQGSELSLLNGINHLLNSKKVKSLVICTHSKHIHDETVRLLSKNFDIKINIPWPSDIGGDGYIYAKLQSDIKND